MPKTTRPGGVHQASATEATAHDAVPARDAAPGHEAPGQEAPGHESAPRHDAAPGHEAPGHEAAPGHGAVTGDPPFPAEPKLEFESTTPYEDYIRASVLTSLQRPLTDEPGELVFIVTSQVMELWFTVLVHEWTTARQALRDDDLPRAMEALRRSTTELEALNASWKPLSNLTPAQFNAYRKALGEGSGFQSVMYRRLEFLLGEKSASMLVPHRAVPSQYAELERALREPSLYDEVLRLLHRRGHAIPGAVLDRDPTVRYEADPGVERVWGEIYAGPQDHELVRLGEALTDVAELVWRWRSDHLMATRRAVGSKPGTGGSAGVAWLEKRVRRNVFPELWSARSHV